MSIYSIDNTKFHFRMGVDHVTSAFFGVWQQPYDNPDNFLVSADNQGVHIHGEVPLEIVRAIEELTERFKIARRQGNPYPNIDLKTINDIARRLGFPLWQRDNMCRYYDDVDYNGQQE